MNKTIILGDINKDTLITYLKSLNNSTECEIRFGNFIYTEGNPPKAEFSSSVEIDFFYRLKNILNQQKGLEKRTLYTKEISYKNADDKKGKLREIIYTDEHFKPTGKTTYMVKNTHRQHNIFDYNCRISLASEKILTRVDGVSLHNPMFFRFKNRVTFNFNVGVLDMTIVYQGKTEEEALSKSNVQYEVEFEIKKPDYDSVVKIMSFIMSIRQDNLYVMNTREKRNIINQYRALVMPQKKGHPYFIGAQPETLQKDQLSLLFKELYSVTDKADGDRYFMFIDARGDVFFIDNNINNILKTDVKSEYTNCLIDGELIRMSENLQTTGISFHAFDIIFYNGQDLRGDENYLLKSRLEMLNNVIVSLPSNEYYTIDMKKFIYRNVFMGSDIIMKNVQNKPYKNDGLIFTPMNEPYPKSKKWIKLLKWKPSELNTIDFYSVKQDGIWKLYVQDSVPEQSTSDTFVKRKTNLVLFDVNKLCNVSETTQITFETTFDESLLDPTTNEPYQTNTVIEYQWKDNKFVPLRTRWDKTANPSKHGNFSSVACSIWSNINNPITPSQLFQMTNTTTENVNSDNNFFFEPMTNFHNKINQYLTNKYVQNLNTSKCDKAHCKSINLELNTFNHVRTDNTFTFCNSIKKTNLSYKNFKLDLTSENACNIIKQSIKQFTYNDNTINSIFCLNFSPFFKSLDSLNKFHDIIDYNINKNGKIILTFIDSKYIQDIQHLFVNNNEIMYYIDYIQNDNIFNNSIKLFVNGITNEAESIEYLVNFEYLSNYMATKGYTCIETESYKKLYDIFKTTNKDCILKDYELNISSLYRYCVFEKTESKTTSLLTTTSRTNTNMTSKSLITHKNLDFYRIQSNYDIYNLLNCLNFTVYKKMHNKFELNSNDDILKSLQLLNQQFVPYFEGKELIQHDKQIYFHNYYYEEPQQEQSDDEPVIINQYYVILYKGKILQSSEDIIQINKLLKEQLTEVEKVEKVEQEKEVTELEEVEEDKAAQRKDEIKQELKESKITVNMLKDYLKEFGLKSTGKKEELLQRLNEHLNKNIRVSLQNNLKTNIN